MEILDVEIVPLLHDLGVLTADGGGIENDIALGMADNTARSPGIVICSPAIHRQKVAKGPCAVAAARRDKRYFGQLPTKRYRQAPPAEQTPTITCRTASCGRAGAWPKNPSRRVTRIRFYGFAAQAVNARAFR